MLIRTSERTQFKRCRQAWWWSYVEQLKPEVEAPALRFGTLIHKALEIYYGPGRKRGPHPAKTFAKIFDSAMEGKPAFGFKTARLALTGDSDDEYEEWTNARELGVEMLNGYVKFFKQYDDEYRIISPERQFYQDVYNARTGQYLFTYVGTIDIVALHLPSKSIDLWDFKTAKAIKTTHLPLDEQSGSYWTYGPPWMVDQGILKPGQTIRRIEFRFLRKAIPPTDRPRNEQGQYLNQNGTISKIQPAPFFHREFVYRDEGDRAQLRQRVKREVREMLMVRQGKLSVYKNPGPFTCMGCAFRAMCELHETGSNWEAMYDVMREWDPYSAHEILQEGK